MRYTKISLRFTTPFDIPYFIGSQIRGALGYALKKVVCINPTYECKECFAAHNCLYHDFYEAKNGYHPYRLDFELGKSYYDLSLYLFEKATDKLPFIVSALHMMLTKNGLGKERTKISEYRLSVNDIPVVKEEKILLPKTPVMVYQPPQKSVSTITLKFLTPLRIKQNNRFVRNAEHLDLRSLINSLYQRKEMLEGRGRARLPFEVQGRIVDNFVHFKDLTRYSGRQKGRLKIGGMLGEMTLAGVDTESYRMLKLGELIGVGKQTVFGLGKIEVVDKI